MVAPRRPIGQSCNVSGSGFVAGQIAAVLPDFQRNGGTMARTSVRPRLIVGISGASGAIYGARLLELLQPVAVETHLVISRSAELTLALETPLKPADLRARADVVHANTDLAAPIASGSFPTIGMVVAPCSIRSMAEIATGVTTTLLTRAADVVLKERRRLVLMVRETPLHTGHLRTMMTLSEIGAVIAPPVPAFYAKPQNLDEMIDQTLGRVLDLFGLDSGTVRRWGEPPADGERPLRSKPRDTAKR